MENRWTLHVRKFGKIESADITVAPMTMFVGANNSGKSYLMTLLYTLLNIRFYKDGYDLCEQSEEYKYCAAWLADNLNRVRRPEGRIFMEEAVQEQFETLLNKVLKKNAARITRRAFNASVPIGELTVSLPKYSKRKEFRIVYDEIGEDDRASYYLQPVIRYGNYTRAHTREGRSRLAISFILEFFLKADFKRRSTSDAVFLPTSRTGFLLTYKSLVRASLSDSFDSEELPTFQESITRPYSDFLKNLASLSPVSRPIKLRPVVQFIEEEMIHGHIALTDTTPQSTLHFQPNETKLELPLYLTSGVVTELTPLLLMLEHHGILETLFIEEPEMGLHPELQLLMARVLVQIQDRQIPLFITTHSDIMIQHINNMIKLNHLPADAKQSLMAQYGYTNRDLLSAGDVAMYQFDISGETGKSTIQALPHNEYGFVVPTFNDALRKILEESRELEGHGGDQDD